MFWKLLDENMIYDLKIQCKSILPLLGGGGPKQGEDEQQEGKGHTVVTVTQEVMVAWGGGAGMFILFRF